MKAEIRSVSQISVLRQLCFVTLVASTFVPSVGIIPTHVRLFYFTKFVRMVCFIFIIFVDLLCAAEAYKRSLPLKVVLDRYPR